MNILPLNTSEPKWAIPMALIAVLAILVQFYSVVADAAKAGELRRQATVTQKTAILHCSALRDVNDRKLCVTGLEAQVTNGGATLLAAQ